MIFFQFLDIQRIDNLTAYLEALHKAQMATEDHTTLLVNCYTKRKDVTKLNEFIMVSIVFGFYFSFLPPGDIIMTTGWSCFAKHFFH